MRMDELVRLIDGGATTATLAEAVGQRLVRPPQDWDWRYEAAVCECGLLLVRLPRAVEVERVVVTLGRAMPVTYRLTHAHAAHASGAPLCPDCAGASSVCGDHGPHLCDTPQPDLCAACWEDPALPHESYCRACLPPESEPEWDKDRYLGF